MTESERHAIAHAKYYCDQATPDDPEVSFHYELVRTLLSLIADAQRQYLSSCLRAGACHGTCESTACTNYGKAIVVRRCVEPKQDGIVYPESYSPDQDAHYEYLSFCNCEKCIDVRKAGVVVPKETM
jgi:hypothetical protein